MTAVLKLVVFLLAVVVVGLIGWVVLNVSSSYLKPESVSTDKLHKLAATPSTASVFDNGVMSSTELAKGTTSQIIMENYPVNEYAYNSPTSGESCAVSSQSTLFLTDIHNNLPRKLELETDQCLLGYSMESVSVDDTKEPYSYVFLQYGLQYKVYRINKFTPQVDISDSFALYTKLQLVVNNGNPATTFSLSNPHVNATQTDSLTNGQISFDIISYNAGDQSTQYIGNADIDLDTNQAMINDKQNYFNLPVGGRINF